ncbi:MAG: hypothetical protein U5J82_07620 [Desulfobacterales bacterium]|nr:hypothetical protein [Desulfobacterales bacterium]
MKRMKNDPDMLEEYDFTGGVRGKYAKRYAEGTNVVVIDPDVAEYFPDHESVNEALRVLTAIIKRQKRAEKEGVEMDARKLAALMPTVGTNEIPMGTSIHLLTCHLSSTRIGIVNEGREPTCITVDAPISKLMSRQKVKIRMVLKKMPPYGVPAGR